VSRAPAEVVEEQRERLAGYVANRETLRISLRELEGGSVE
jgi:hypothetical protein